MAGRLRRNPALWATVFGSGAIALWGLLPRWRLMAALFPPLQLSAMALALAAAVAWLGSRAVHSHRRRVATPLAGRDWLLGCAALLGALALYFFALTQGPAAPVTLVTYLWPLIYVVLDHVTAGRRPPQAILLGALLGLLGTALVVVRQNGFDPAALAATPWDAYAAAIANGLCWAVFSLHLKRRAFSAAGFARLFAGAGLMAAGLHALLETAVLPASPAAWLAALAIGVGPYGLAFMAWGNGLTRGYASLLGTLSYAVPVLASAVLILAGRTQPDWALAVAAAAVASGAWLASRPAKPA